MPKAEVYHPSNDEVPQILVGEKSRPLNHRENVESCPAGRVGHWGQVNERLDRPVPELLPNPVIFLSHLVVCRVQRPVDTYAPEEFESRFDGALALIQGSVEFRLQAGDGGAVSQIPSAARQRRQPFFCRRKIAAQKLALSPLELQREGERVLLLPALLCQQRPASDKVGERRGIGRRSLGPLARDRKSTRLNSSHVEISYAVFCLKKKKRSRAVHNDRKRHDRGDGRKEASGFR